MAALSPNVVPFDAAPNALGEVSPERRAYYAALLGDELGKVLHPLLAPLHDPETRAAALAGLADVFAAEMMRAARHGRTRRAGEATTLAVAKLMLTSLKARSEAEFARPADWPQPAGERA